MHGDFSRWPIDVANIVGPLQQQGRVLLDTQQNAATAAMRRWQDEAARAAFGSRVAAVPSGNRDAFKVVSAQLVGTNVSIEATPGELWADGILVQLPSSANGQSIPACYLGPPFETLPTTDIGQYATRDAVILEVWRAALSGFQDSRLLEPALGGPDTFEMLQTQFAFRLFRMADGDTCETIRGRIQDDFSTRGTLTVTLAPTTVSSGDCPVVQGGGYSGFEHNLYRIEIAAPDATSFKWSRYNGGLVGTALYDGTSKLIVIGNLPAITSSGLTNCYVEAFTIDQYTGAASLVYAAKGTLGSDGTISLGSATAGGISSLPLAQSGSSGSQSPIFFRLWDGLVPVSSYATTTQLVDGISLQFSGAANLPGDYWTFPVRAGDIGNPTTLINDRPPGGVHRHRVPLGVLNWSGTAVLLASDIDDCRVPFRPLTDNDCCCTVTVGDGVSSEGDFTSIQCALDSLPNAGGRVCIQPGTYTENVVMNGFGDVVISGCGAQTRIQSVTPAAGATAAPVFRAVDCQNLRIENLGIAADPSGIGVQIGSRDGADPSRDVTLQFLDLAADGGAAIEVNDSVSVRIRDCNILMGALVAGVPGIIASGSDITIERNRVVLSAAYPNVLPGGDYLRGGHGRPAVRNTDLNIARNENVGRYENADRYANVARVAPSVNETFGGGAANAGNAKESAVGGIWLQGGTNQARILGNWIAGGRGNGIMLGSAVTKQDDGTLIRVYTATVNPSDCATCDPNGNHVPSTKGGSSVSSDGAIQYQADDALSDIVIEGNSISNMGMNGIGVYAFFGDLANQGIITVVGLRIANNSISNCLRLATKPTPKDAQDLVGYGGIALADVECATINGNLIRNNGTLTLNSAVCGIFILHASDVEIATNEITGNGANGNADAQAGPRGGIWVTYASAPMQTIDLGGPALVPEGVPALRMNGNRVESPLGRALTINGALGSISVVDNWLVSRGVDSSGDNATATTVFIYDFAVDREFAVPGGFLTALNQIIGDQTAAFSPSVSEDELVFLPDGNVLFANNQVSLELAEGQVPVQSSIAIVSLDDVAFIGNQCECFGFGIGTVEYHVFIMGLSARCQGNRIKESLDDQTELGAPTISGVIFSFVMNVTSGNVSTHCLNVLPAYPAGIKTDNVELVGLRQPGFCSPDSLLTYLQSLVPP